MFQVRLPMAVAQGKDFAFEARARRATARVRPVSGARASSQAAAAQLLRRLAQERERDRRRRARKCRAGRRSSGRPGSVRGRRRKVKRQSAFGSWQGPCNFAHRAGPAGELILPLSRQDLADGGGYIAGHQAVLLQQLVGLAGFGVDILDAHELHGARMGFRHHLRHAHAQCRNPPGALRPPRWRRSRPRRGAMASRSIGLTVCMSITRAEMPSASSVSAASMRLRHQQAVGDDGDVATRPATWMALPISNFWLAVIDHRRLGTAGADEDRAHVRRRGADQRFGGGFVGRRDHHETRQRAGQRRFPRCSSARGRLRRSRCRCACPPPSHSRWDRRRRCGAVRSPCS